MKEILVAMFGKFRHFLSQEILVELRDKKHLSSCRAFS